MKKLYFEIQISETKMLQLFKVFKTSDHEIKI